MTIESRSKTDLEKEARDINYYLILGLEYDPPVMDINVINERIELCKKFWNKNSNDSQNGLLYKTYVSLINNIKTDMADVSVRTIHSDIAKSCVTARVIQYLNAVKSDSSLVSYENVMAIISSLNGQLEHDFPRVRPLEIDSKGALKKVKFISESLVSKIASKNNITIAEKKDYRTTYNKFYKYPPVGLNKNTDVATYNGYQVPLDAAGKDDLYGFLGMHSSEKATTLHKVADERYRKITKHDNEADIEKQLASAARNVFISEEEKKKYDLYLSWKNAVREFEKIKSDELSGTLRETDLNDYITNLVRYGIPKEDVREAIDAYCQIEKINPPWSQASSNSTKSFIICAGCHKLELNTGVSNCSDCKTPLWVSCPNCGKETSIGLGDTVCQYCNTSLVSVSKALFKYYEARKSLESLDYDTAEQLVKDAELQWPKSSESKKVRDEIRKSKEYYGKDFASIKSAVVEKRYFAARELYQRLQRRVPGYHDVHLISDINYAIKTSEQYAKSVTPQATEADILEICSQVSRICSDYPQIIKLMERYPPEPVRNITAIFNKQAKVVHLKWEKSPASGDITYVIVRKENNAPGNLEDGERVGVTPICDYTDTSIEAGKCYRYAVFTQRTGIFSSGCTLETPIITNFNISNLKLTPENRAIRLSWQRLPSTASIQILRDGKEIQHVPESGYLDSNLQNDVQYTYKVRLVYTINGKRYDSDWSEDVATPSLPPDSISTLRIRSLGENQYQASWTYDGKETVEFYCSEEKPPYNLNDSVPVHHLRTCMQKLPVRISGNVATFQHSSLKTLYVTAVILKNGVCYIGNVARVTNNQIFTIKDVRLVNGDIVIWFDRDIEEFPSDIAGFKIMYGFDSYPTNPDDSNHPKDQKKYVTMREFRRSETLIIPLPVQKDYYISIFVEVKSGAGDSDFPYSCETMFSNTPINTVRYSLHKSFLAKTWEIIFKTEKPCTLPEIDMSYVAGCGHAPIQREDGRIIQRIPEQTINRKLSVDLELPNEIPSGSHVKPFIVDNEKRRKVRLILDDNETTLVS